MEKKGYLNRVDDLGIMRSFVVYSINNDMYAQSVYMVNDVEVISPEKQHIDFIDGYYGFTRELGPLGGSSYLLSEFVSYEMKNKLLEMEENHIIKLNEEVHDSPFGRKVFLHAPFIDANNNIKTEFIKISDKLDDCCLAKLHIEK